MDSLYVNINTMDIIEICPPTNLSFSLPLDLQRVLTITNLTLRSIYITILKSHPYQIALSRQRFVMSAFEEVRLEVTLNYNQDALNSTRGKLRIYYYEIEEDESEHQIEVKLFTRQNNIQFEDINIHCDVHQTTKSFLTAPPKGNYYLMRRVYPRRTKLGGSLGGQKLKDEIFNYLQHIQDVLSIEECQKNQSFLIEFKESHEDSAQFVTFGVNSITFIYSIARILAYGKGYEIPTLVNVDQRDQPLIVPSPINAIQPTKIEINQKQNEWTEQKLPQVNKQLPEVPHKPQQSNIDKKKKQLIKQSFAVKTGKAGRNKRRNKSQQKIQERSSDEEEDEPSFVHQFINIKQAQKPVVAPVKIRRQVKINETNIEMNEKVLNVYIENKLNMHYIYVVLRDCVRVLLLEDPSFKRVFKFDAIDKQNINMPTPIDIYKDQLIFGNQSYLFWVNLQTGFNQWKYVQRKYIYAVSVIEELGLVALGGKNFSKLSYFGKETSRSNIKLYSCISSDKHDHLFTYDIPGNNVGHVTNMAYVTTPPLATKLLLVHTINAQSKSSFYFLRVKAFNKIQVYGQVQLDDLGILSLLKFKYNKATHRIICMQALGDTEMDGFKKLKIKCESQKVQVSTQGLKFPLTRYISFHLGGQKEGVCREWMSIVEQNGLFFHLYDFEGNKLQKFELGKEKGQIKQVFSLYNGKFLVICSQTVVKIREKVQIQIKQ